MCNMECSQPRDSWMGDSIDKEWLPVRGLESRQEFLYLPGGSETSFCRVRSKERKTVWLSSLNYLYKILDFQEQKHREVIKLFFWHLWTFSISRSVLCEASWAKIQELHWCSFILWTISMSEFWLCFNCCIAEQPQPKRRRRIDRSMIGEPTNFVHTAHVGSGDLFSGMNSVSSIQNQMQSKGGYGGGMAASAQMQLVDTKAG